MAAKSRKNEILAFINWFVAVNGFSPSYREIGEKVGLRSISTVGKYVKQLEAEGRLTANHKQRCRSLAVARCVSMPMNDPDSVQRIELETADGGVIYVDCNVNRDENDQAYVTFSGVLDATQLKSHVCNVVRCGIIPE